MCLQMATAQINPDEQTTKLANIFENFPQITENFHNFSRIGEATFSTVYQASYINENNFSLAFKVLVPTSGPDRVEKEIQLQVLNGQQNVMTLSRACDTRMCISSSCHISRIRSFKRFSTPKY